MAGGEFVGRPRPLWKIILYTLLTVGVYGRVYLYRTVKEIDGHEVFFLDLRLYRLGVILPALGPLIVKWRLVGLVDQVVQHDVTARPVHRAGLKWASLVPWFPLVHMLIQRHLKHHWALHGKLADVEARRVVLAEKRRVARTKEQQAEVREMEAAVEEREKEIQDAQQGAVALREAALARERAQREIKEAGGRKRRSRRFRPSAILARFKGRGREPEAEVPLAPEPVTEPPRRGHVRREPVVPEPVPEPVPEVHPLQESKKSRFGVWSRRKKEDAGVPDEVPPTTAQTQAEPAAKKSRFRFLRRKKPAEAEAEVLPEPRAVEEPTPRPAETKPRRFGFSRRKTEPDVPPPPEPAAAPEPTPVPEPEPPAKRSRFGLRRREEAAPEVVPEASGEAVAEPVAAEPKSKFRLFGRKKAGEAAPEAAAEAAAQPAARETKSRFRLFGRKTEVPAVGEDVAEDAAAEPSEPAKKSRFGFLSRKKKEPVAPRVPETVPVPEPVVEATRKGKRRPAPPAPIPEEPVAAPAEETPARPVVPPDGRPQLAEPSAKELKARQKMAKARAKREARQAKKREREIQAAAKAGVPAPPPDPPMLSRRERKWLEKVEKLELKRRVKHDRKLARWERRFGAAPEAVAPPPTEPEAEPSPKRRGLGVPRRRKDDESTEAARSK